MKIVDIKKLKPLEMVFPEHLNNLKKMIEKSGYIKSPIIADENTGIILDGSHRFIFLFMEGYQLVPVHYIDYQNENIRVGTHLMHRHIIHGSVGISKKEVVERGLSGNLFPPRTTRHFFPFRKNINANVNLSELKKANSIDASRFIADVSRNHEINHNNRYIEELEFELDEIIKYMDEMRQTKNYLKKQIQLMGSE